MSAFVLTVTAASDGHEVAIDHPMGSDAWVKARDAMQAAYDELGRHLAEQDRCPAKPRAPARQCQTPGTIYSFGLDSANTLRVRLRFPFNIEHWASGTSAVTEGPKLQRYDQMYGERKRIEDLIHDHMEAVGADCYHVMEPITAQAPPGGFKLAASEWNAALAGRPFTLDDWWRLTFGERKAYRRRENLGPAENSAGQPSEASTAAPATDDHYTSSPASSREDQP